MRAGLSGSGAAHERRRWELWSRLEREYHQEETILAVGGARAEAAVWRLVSVASAGMIRLEYTMRGLSDPGYFSNGISLNSQELAAALTALPAWSVSEACEELHRLEGGGQPGAWHVEVACGEVIFRFRDPAGSVLRMRTALDVHRLWRGERRDRRCCGHPLYTLGVAWCRLVASGGIAVPVPEVSARSGPDRRWCLAPDFLRHSLWVRRAGTAWDGRGVLFGTRAEFAEWDESRIGLEGVVREGEADLPAMGGSFQGKDKLWKIPGRRWPPMLSPGEGSGRGCRGLTDRDRVTAVMWQVACRAPQKARQQEVCMLSLKVRDLARELWVGGWQPGRDLEKLQRGVRGIERLLVQVGERRWSPFRAVGRDLRDANLESALRFWIVWPPGSNSGASIRWSWLRSAAELGRRARWAACSLAYEFDAQKWDVVQRVQSAGGIPSRSRVYGTVPEVRRTEDGQLADERGKALVQRDGMPVRDWRDERVGRTGGRVRNPELDAVPVLGTWQLAELVGREGGGSARELSRGAYWGRQVLEDMQSAGLVDVERLSRGRLRVAEAWPGAE